MRRFWAVGLLTALVTACTQEKPAPNVIVITWDTVRADRVGRQIRGVSTTPVFDRLAAQGVLFTEARTSAPVTLPAHASLMTGVHPPTHGARDNGRFTLGEQLPMLPEDFLSRGYATGAFVSAYVIGSQTGLGRGFQHFDDGAGKTVLPYRRGDETVDAAIAWWNSVPEDRPRFMWVHLFDSHRPWVPSPESWKRHDGDAYQAEIAFTDQQTGRLLEALGSRLEESLVVLTADHGEGLGEHGEETHTVFAYDSTMRVPMVWWWGERLEDVGTRGRVAAGPAALVDVVPTVRSLLGWPVGSTEGRSLAPVFKQGEVAPRELPLEAVSGAFMMNTAPVFGVLDTTGKTWFDLPRRELYDVTVDPGQENNIYRPPQSEALDALAARHPRSWPPQGAGALDSETAEQLAALGYVSFEPVLTDEAATDPKDSVDLMRFLMTAKLELSLKRAEAEGARLQAKVGWVPSLVQYLMEYYDDLGHRGKATEILRLAIAAHPDRAEWQALWTQRARAREEKEALVKRIRAAVVQSPGNADAHFDLGTTLRYLERFDEAEVSLKEALRLAPGDTEAVLQLAHVLRTRGDVALAVTLLESRVGAHPLMRCDLARFQYVHGQGTAQAAANLEACWAAGGRLIGPDYAFLGQTRLPR